MYDIIRSVIVVQLEGQELWRLDATNEVRHHG